MPIDKVFLTLANYIFFVLNNLCLLSDAETLENWARESICIMSSDEELEEEEEVDGDDKLPMVNNDEEEEEEEQEEEETDANCQDQAKVHVKTETPLKSKVFACNFCGNTYTSKQGLDSHKAGSH